MRVLFSVAGVGEAPFTSFKLTNKWLFPGMGAFVYLEVLGASKELATVQEGTFKWFLAGMNANVIDKFVLSFEWFSFAITV